MLTKLGYKKDRMFLVEKQLAQEVPDKQTLIPFNGVESLCHFLLKHHF